MKAGAVELPGQAFREQDMLDAVSAAVERAQQQHATDAAKSSSWSVMGR